MKWQRPVTVPDKPYVVVLRQFGGLGDFVLLSYIFLELRKKYPGHEIHLVTNGDYMSGALMELAQSTPGIDQIHDIYPWVETTMDTLRVHEKTCKGAHDIMRNPLLQGAAHVVDMNWACVEYEMRTMPNVDKTRGQIWAEHAGVWPCDTKPQLIFDTDTRERVAEDARQRGWLGCAFNVVGVSVTSNDPSRSLSKSQTWEIMNGLRAQGLRPVTIGTNWECPGFEHVPYGSMQDTMGYLYHMDAVVAVDSAILHLAGAMGTPIVGLFGPTDPAMRMGNYTGVTIDARTLVPCAHCWYRRPCNDRNESPVEYMACMKRINPAIVVEMTQRLLDSR